ncbi:MAG: response regulator [Lachnospiraceae bacterium]|nr:response regulator [Lachnospiraceae bacterium]
MSEFIDKRILIADDDEIHLAIIEKMLKELGADVISVRDGGEAIDTYRDEHGKFDLLILDLIMPKFGGLDVAQKIRSVDAIPGALNIPIITMTAHNGSYDPDRAKAVNISEHLIKPIDPEDLLNVIRKYLN